MILERFNSHLPQLEEQVDAGFPLTPMAKVSAKTKQN